MIDIDETGDGAKSADANSDSARTPGAATPPAAGAGSEGPAAEQAPLEPGPLERSAPPMIDPPQPADAPKAAQPESASFFRRRSPTPLATSVAPPPPAPKKKPRRDGTLSIASGFLSFLLVVLVAGAFGWIAATHKLREPGPLQADKIVYIPPRSDKLELIAQLQREGVIDAPTLMQFALIAERAELKRGEYEFKKNASLREVIDQMIAGRQVQHSITIPEGLTSEQIVQRLKEVDLLSGGITEIPKEGALLPETYKFPRGYPRRLIIGKMQDDQRKLLDQIWAKRSPDLPLTSAYELVTLASIVEKETGRPEERPKVAAVFVNRLRKHMRLQSDPTIVYGLVGGKGTLGHGILRAELDKYTPYNTYQIDGLPPGPIANPGRAALEATAHPAKIDALYFVADGAGGHTFSGSLGDHSRAVQNWRKIEKDKKDALDRGAPDMPAPEAPPPRGDKRTQAPIGALLNLAERHEDYPSGRVMAADDGATHRLGKFSPADAAFLLGGNGDPTAINGREYAELRPARPFFTEESAQMKASAGFSEELLAVNAPARSEQSSEGDLNPDMTTVGTARESADGRALPDETDAIATYPVSPARRAEQKARAARLGLAAGSDELPVETIAVDAPEAQKPGAAAAGAMALAPTAQPQRPRAFDASEGTALDPLRDKSWDLTSAKTVPTSTNAR